MASNYTKNYGLCQWEATDQVRREEFNQDNTKMDETLKTLADKDTALDGAIAAVAAAAGNCNMELFTYTGTGTYGEGKATKITFSTKPDFYFVGGDKALMIGYSKINPPLVMAQNALYSQCEFYVPTASWSGSTLSVISNEERYQLNSKSKQYWVLGLKRKGA